MSVVIRSASNRGIRAARLLGLALASAVFLAALPASSQEADLKPLMDRLQRLERDIQTMNIQMSRGGMAPPPLSGSSSAPSSDMSLGGDQPGNARLEVRLTALENEVRAVTGRVEEAGHQIDQVNQRLEKLIGDMDFRLSQLERGGAEVRGQAPGTPPRQTAEGSQAGTSAMTAPSSGQMARPNSSAPGLAPPPGVLGTLPRQDAERAGQGTVAPSTGGGAQQAQAQSATVKPGALPAGSPKEQYDHAFGLLRQARYDEAEAALRAFLDSHPKDPLAGNANYWLGESFYVRADYVRAAEVFLEGYQREPKGSKAADTLLKLGMSLSNLDKKREACAAFDKLTKEFPGAPGTIQQVVTRERQKNACK